MAADRRLRGNPLAPADSGGWALASVETTVLMTVEETLEALAKAKEIGYRRPGELPGP